VKILVTGGAGFIGSHLCRRLVGLGYHVICIDNLLTGTQDRIADLIEHNNFKFIKGDVTDRHSLDFAVLDQIYHLASPASPVHYQADPVKTTETVVFGTYNILQLAQRCRAKVLYASTSEIYGDPLVHPQRETYWGNVNPIGPRSCYDEGKRCAETLCHDFAIHRGVEAKIIRIFNTYGPAMSMNDGRVVPNFILQALGGNDLTVYGDGRQTRSFCYIEDLLASIFKVMATENDFLGPVNLGNTEAISVANLAKLIIKLTKSTSKVVLCPLPQDDPTQRCPDITYAYEKLGWRPIVSLQEGLEKTIAYYRWTLQYGFQATKSF